MAIISVPALDPAYPQNISREELHQDQPSLSFSLWLLFDDHESSEMVNFLKIQHSITAFLLICSTLSAVWSIRYCESCSAVDTLPAKQVPSIHLTGQIFDNKFDCGGHTDPPLTTTSLFLYFCPPTGLVTGGSTFNPGGADVVPCAQHIPLN